MADYSSQDIFIGPISPQWQLVTGSGSFHTQCLQWDARDRAPKFQSRSAINRVHKQNIEC